MNSHEILIQLLKSDNYLTTETKFTRVQTRSDHLSLSDNAAEDDLKHWSTYLRVRFWVKFTSFYRNVGTCNPNLFKQVFLPQIPGRFFCAEKYGCLRLKITFSRSDLRYYFHVFHIFNGNPKMKYHMGTVIDRFRVNDHSSRLFI